jgi:hypothetical protein
MEIPWSKVGSIAAVVAALPFIVWYAEHEETSKLGKPCTQERVGECWGPEQRIYCIDGKWVSEPCRGPKGCSLGPTGKDKMAPILCDTSKNVAGDVCLNEGVASCSADGQDLLRCEGRKLSVTACGKGCRVGSDGASCVGL